MVFAQKEWLLHRQSRYQAVSSVMSHYAYENDYQFDDSPACPVLEQMPQYRLITGLSINMSVRKIKNSITHKLNHHNIEAGLNHLEERPVYQSHILESEEDYQDARKYSHQPPRSEKLNNSLHSSHSFTCQQQSQFQFKPAERLKQSLSSSPPRLAPIDQKVEMPFESVYYPSLLLNHFKTSITPLEDELRDWLVDLVEITTSVAFNLVQEKRLSSVEVKNFIAKNLLHNIKMMLQGLRQMPFPLRFKIVKFVNQEAIEVLKQVSQKYPQNSSKGVSKRIKSHVQNIDNSQSDQFDFLRRNGIHLHYRQDTDYSQDIMKVLNRLIAFSNDPYDPHMEQQDTNFEVFSQLMELLFDTSGHQSAPNTANQFLKTLEEKKKQTQQAYSPIKIRILKQEEEVIKRLDSRQFWQGKELPRQVSIGQKIPPEAPLFSEEDIESSKFKLWDSSMLRVLTRWANQLRQKIFNPEESLYRRIYKFKNNRGRLINLQPTMKEYLYEAAIQEVAKAEEYLQQLREENYYLQTIFGDEEVVGKYCKMDTKAGVFAAKLHEMSCQYVFKYLNRLIHCLLSIPRAAAQRVESDWEKAVLMSVDLVSLKVDDLLRCQCACSEYQFVKILNVLDYMHLNNPQVLKLIRIKNRLGSDHNDLVINFSFGSKASCQMQLSVLSSQSKSDSSSDFRHLISELGKADLGPLSQMGSIMVQHDPLVRFFSQSRNHQPQLVTKHTRNASHVQCSDQNLAKLGKHVQYPFVCSTCHNLTIVHNPSFLERGPEKPKMQCNQCLIQTYNQDPHKLKDYLLQQNFPEPKANTFYHHHLELWDKQAFLTSLEKQNETDSSTWFPSRGFMLQYNQKVPHMELFTSLYDSTSSYILFANKDSIGRQKVLQSIKVYRRKDRRIQHIQQQLQHFLIMTVKDVIAVEEEGVHYYICNRKGCCGLKVTPGVILPRQDMEDYKSLKIIERSVDKQKKMLFLNYMPKSLDHLGTFLHQQQHQSKSRKAKRIVQSIEAYQCQLQKIDVVGVFKNLLDLNIGGNPGITHLRGIENCLNLKYLDCNGCDLTDVDELRDLSQLESLNLANNRRLENIDSLEPHSQLFDLFLKNTRVQSLAPLENCIKLETLDLEGCQYVSSIRSVTSTRLSYISIIDCTGLTSFDLPAEGVKSLKTVELHKNANMPSFDELIQEAARFNDPVISPQSPQPGIDEQTIHKINKFLHVRRAQSIYT